MPVKPGNDADFCDAVVLIRPTAFCARVCIAAADFVRCLKFSRTSQFPMVSSKPAIHRSSLLVMCVCVMGGFGSAATAAEADQVKAGAAIYEQRCSPCHGENLRNVSGGWSFDLRRLHPDEHDRFVDSVTTGKDNMPSWYGILSADEIEAIWAYIRATVDK